MKSVRFNPLTSLVTVAALAIGLAACGGSSTTPEPMPPPPPPPHVCEAGPSQACVDARMEELAALGDDASKADHDAATAALAAAQKALADANAATARAALVSAAMCTDATDACIAHHDALIAALMADLAALRASDDATNAQIRAAEAALTTAQTARSTVAMDLDEIDRSTTLGSAVGDAVDAANGLEDERSADEIAAAEALLATAKGMLTDADDYAAQIEMAEMAIARAKARNAVDAAVMAAETASGALTGDQSKATVEAARAAVDAAKQAVMDNADALTDADETGFNAQIALAEAPIGPLESKIAADEAAEAKRIADEKAAEEKRKNDAMAVTAAKLRAGIAAQNGDVANTTAAGTALAAADERGAAYNNDGVPEAGIALDTRIMVGIGTNTPVPLSEDKKATVADLHGWTGKRYTAEPDDDGMYEARVYSNVGAPTMGAKFNSGSTGDDNVGFDTTDGVLTFAAEQNLAARISSPSFDHNAGYKTFKLPDPNPSGADIITISGSYYGVAGMYACTPAVADDGCRVNRAASGYTLALTGAGGGGWTFTATNAEARVTEMADANYASYGWWIHKSEGGDKYTASAFADVKGAVTPAAGLDTLQGTATYVGGAAGKYALSSSTGGTNDAGHFTATATLNADFSDNSITGTIDNFTGADDMSRDDWSVELKEATVAATGGITRIGADQTDNDTVWTIGDTAAAASGEWSGTLYDNGDDGVPKVGTGTFYSTFGQDGKMVGAFGVNKQ